MLPLSVSCTDGSFVCVVCCVFVHACGCIVVMWCCVLALCFHVGVAVAVAVDDIVAMALWLDCCCCGTVKLLVWTMCGCCRHGVMMMMWLCGNGGH